MTLCNVSIFVFMCVFLGNVTIIQELLPSVANLISDPFASHVLRALLALLCPRLSSLESSDAQTSNFRSKKSQKFRTKQGPMKSVFVSDEQETPMPRKAVPELLDMARTILLQLRKELNSNEIRALAADKVACPTLAVRIELSKIV